MSYTATAHRPYRRGRSVSCSGRPAGRRCGAASRRGAWAASLKPPTSCWASLRTGSGRADVSSLEASTSVSGTLCRDDLLVRASQKLEGFVFGALFTGQGSARACGFRLCRGPGGFSHLSAQLRPCQLLLRRWRAPGARLRARRAISAACSAPRFSPFILASSSRSRTRFCSSCVADALARVDGPVPYPSVHHQPPMIARAIAAARAP